MRRALSTPVANVHDVRRAVRARLPIDVWDYIDGGAGTESTVRANEEAFRRIVLTPRILVDVERRDLATTVLGTPVAAPLGIAPTSYHTLVHPDGEVGTARAAAGLDLLDVVSVFSSMSLEEVAKAATGPRWFQVYCMRDRGLTRSLIERAESAGYQALVLGVDLPVIGYRDRDVRNGFGLPAWVSPANLTGAVGAPAGYELTRLNDVLVTPTTTWHDVEWIRGLTRLPLVLKGILTAPDAKRAAALGAQGILVSNHGGRQLDGSVPTASALPEVVSALAGACEVYLDGGVRRGTDVLKAVALGARMALLGRPVMWGLAFDGAAGVEAVLRMYLDELDLAMAVCGCPDLASIGPHLLRAAPG